MPRGARQRPRRYGGVSGAARAGVQWLRQSDDPTGNAGQGGRVPSGVSWLDWNAAPPTGFRGGRQGRVGRSAQTVRKHDAAQRLNRLPPGGSGWRQSHDGVRGSGKPSRALGGDTAEQFAPRPNCPKRPWRSDNRDSARTFRRLFIPVLVCVWSPAFRPMRRPGSPVHRGGVNVVLFRTSVCAFHGPTGISIAPALASAAGVIIPLPCD
jgi:hypothetical protein